MHEVGQWECQYKGEGGDEGLRVDGYTEIIQKRRDYLCRKRTTVLHGGECRQPSIPRESLTKMKKETKIPEKLAKIIVVADGT